MGYSKHQIANSVVTSVVEAAKIYRVPFYRMQSRVINVEAKKDKRGWRPLAIGEWFDALGVRHTKGMADLLLTPLVLLNSDPRAPTDQRYFAVPLWVECKSGGATLTKDQELFRDYVVSAGAYYIECHDAAVQVLEWFRANGLKVGGGGRR